MRWQNECQLFGWVLKINGDGCRRFWGSNQLTWSKGRQPTGAMLYSSHEPSELSQWLCHDDGSINIVICIINIVICIVINLWVITQMLWIRSLWQSASSQQLLIHLLPVQGRRSKVVEFLLVSCSRLDRLLVCHQLRTPSGQHWQSSTHRSLYHLNTATTLSYEVDNTMLCIHPHTCRL